MTKFRQERDYQDETLALIAFEVGVLYAQGKLLDDDSLANSLMHLAFNWALEFEVKVLNNDIDMSDYLEAVRKFTHEKLRGNFGFDVDAVGHNFTGKVVTIDGCEVLGA